MTPRFRPTLAWIARICLLAPTAWLATSCSTISTPQVVNADASVARLQSGGSLADEVDRLAQPLVQRGELFGVAVGVVTADGKTHVFGYGRTDASGNQQPPTGDTVFQIGSVSKLFVAAVLAELVSEGKVSYEDTVRSILPADVPVGEEAGKVTLYELAMHTGGFPREPICRRQMQDLFLFLFRGRNLYAYLTKQFTYEYLRTSHLPPPDKRKYEYSNLGYGLLAHLLALKTGQSYPLLLEEKICRPLNLRDTTLTLTAEQRARLTLGHAGTQPRFLWRGTPMKPWDMGDLMGPAGGVYSTVNDMLILAKANLGQLHHPLEPVLASMQRPRLKGPDFEEALTWEIDTVNDDHVKITFKQGMVSGYNGYIGLNRDAQIAVVVLGNSFIPRDKLGHNLLFRLSRGLKPPAKH